MNSESIVKHITGPFGLFETFEGTVYINMKDISHPLLCKLALMLLAGSLLAGCEKQSTPETSSPAPTLSEAKQTTGSSQGPHLFFLKAAQQSFELSHKSAIELKEAVSTFTDKPTAENLNSALATWEQAHNHYLATQLFRNVNLIHPQLDLSQSLPEVIHPIEIRLDQHPIIPGYLDAVEGYPASGLIYSEFVISEENLNTEHQFSDTAYVAMGFHALEFMLNGDSSFDQPHSVRFASIDDKKQNSPTKPTEEWRRSKYLLLLSSLIVKDTEQLLTEWSSESGFYPQTLLSMGKEQLDQLIISALDLEKASLSMINTNTASDETETLHQNQKSVDARTELLSSVIQQIIGSGHPLPDSLLITTTQEEPEQTKP